MWFKPASKNIVCLHKFCRKEFRSPVHQRWVFISCFIISVHFYIDWSEETLSWAKVNGHISEADAKYHHRHHCHHHDPHHRHHHHHHHKKRTVISQRVTSNIIAILASHTGGKPWWLSNHLKIDLLYSVSLNQDGDASGRGYYPTWENYEINLHLK